MSIPSLFAASAAGYAKRYAAALCLCGLLAGCSSLQSSLPKPKSNQDTVFAVPVLLLDTMTPPLEAGANFAYQFNLEHVQTGAKVSIAIGPWRPYVYFQGFAAGEYVIKSYVLVGFRGTAFPQDLGTDKYLVLENGNLSLFPYKVVMVARSPTDGTGGARISMFLMQMDHEQEVRTRQYLSAEPNFTLWVR